MNPLPTQPQDSASDALPELKNFSLVLGGPLYQLIRKTRLDDDVHSHLRRRILVICAITWLPLLLLCALNGTLTGGVAVPFLSDVETHARYLLAVPLMLFAELLVHRRIRGIVSQFVERKLIPAGSQERFRAAVLSAMAWRNSIAAELALIVLVCSDQRLRGHQGDHGGSLQPRHLHPVGMGHARAVRPAGAHDDSTQRVARPDRQGGVVRCARQFLFARKYRLGMP